MIVFHAISDLITWHANVTYENSIYVVESVTVIFWL